MGLLPNQETGHTRDLNTQQQIARRFSVLVFEGYQTWCHASSIETAKKWASERYPDATLKAGDLVVTGPEPISEFEIEAARENLKEHLRNLCSIAREIDTLLPGVNSTGYGSGGWDHLMVTASERFQRKMVIVQKARNTLNLLQQIKKEEAGK